MIFRDYLRMTTCIALPGRTLLLLAIVLAGALCFAAPALATTTGTTGDFAWSDNGSRVTITGCATATCPATLTIPATLDIGGGVLHPVTHIGDTAFQNQTTLTAVTFTPPSNVTTIGYNAFWTADNLTTLAIPSGVTTIGDGAFGHTRVPTFTIPTGVTTIASMAFYGAHLTSISIPRGITTIGEQAFYGAMYLEQFDVDSNNLNFSSDSNGSLFNKTKTTLLNYTYGKTATSYTIPDTVTTLGDSAFTIASHLQRVTIPSSVTTMGWGTFYSTGALTRVEFLGDPPACPLCNEYSFWGNNPTVYRYASASNWPSIGTLYFGAPQAYLEPPTPGTPSGVPTPETPSGATSDTPASRTPTSSAPSVRIASNRASNAAITTTLNVTGPGTIVVAARGSIARGSRASKQLVVCKATKKVGAAGTVKVVCPFTKATRTALRRQAIKATLTTTFTPTGGSAQTASALVMLRRR